MHTLKKLYGKQGEEVLIAYCKRPDELVKVIAKELSTSEWYDLVIEIKKMKIDWQDSENLYSNLKNEIERIYEEIIAEIGSKGFREKLRQALMKEKFLEKFKLLEYPYDTEPDIQFTIQPTIGHKVNVNIVFLVKDSKGIVMPF